MAEPPLVTLARWEDAGAGWRLHERTESGVTVALLTCTGEPVELLHSDDPELLDYLARRPSSEDPVTR